MKNEWRKAEEKVGSTNHVADTAPALHFHDENGERRRKT
jgi:hypothetical protein